MPHSPVECANLLEKRSPKSFEKRTLIALGVLGGGNLRETINLASFCLETDLNSEAPITLLQALSTILGTEAGTIRNEALGTELSEAIKVEAYQSLEPDQFSTENLGNLGDHIRNFLTLVLEQISEDADISPENLKTLIDVWSKFHVRYTIAEYIFQNPEILQDTDFTAELQEVARLSNILRRWDSIVLKI